jgi:Na+/H+-translocating membrane pyrophosphatase
MEGRAKPDYATCVKISTDASLREMIPPGALVMLTPLIAGTFSGVETLAGVLAGSLVSGVQVCYDTCSLKIQKTFAFSC